MKGIEINDRQSLAHTTCNYNYHIVFATKYNILYIY